MIRNWKEEELVYNELRDFYRQTIEDKTREFGVRGLAIEIEVSPSQITHTLARNRVPSLRKLAKKIEELTGTRTRQTAKD